MFRSSERSLSRDRAWSCIMLNVATPGTGSMRAGRVFSGMCQLLLAITGAALLCTWILKSTWAVIQKQTGMPAPQHPIGWLWHWGVICFAASWTWTFITCVDLFRRAKAEEEKKNLQGVPPRLADLPKKDSENQ